MGIKHLKTILSDKCEKTIGHFKKITDFVHTDKKRLFENLISTKKINGPIEKMRVSKNINNIPYLLGVDAHLYITKYKRVFVKIECGFIKQIMQFLSAGIIPVYVFDGRAPEQKKRTINNRKNNKIKTRNRLNELLLNNQTISDHNTDFYQIESSNDTDLQNNISNKKYQMDVLKALTSLPLTEIIQHVNTIFNNNVSNFNKTSDPVSVEHLLHNPNNKSEEYNRIMRLIKKSLHIENKDIDDLKKFLSFLRIPFIVAEGEADDQMASLYNKKIIHACLSDDMDMLPKGCENLIQMSADGIHQYYLPKILTELKLSREQFIDLCILLGSDYNTLYVPMDAKELYERFTKCTNPSIETFFAENAIHNFDNTSIKIEQFQSIRKYFAFSELNINSMLYFSLKMLHVDDILMYFNKIGILFNDTYIRRFRDTTSKINNFIISLPLNFLITH